MSDLFVYVDVATGAVRSAADGSVVGKLMFNTADPYATVNLEAGAGDLVERLRSAARKVRALKEWFTLAGAAKTTLHRLAETSDQAAAQLASVTAENARLREALNLIDALDPEEHIYGTSHDACRGLIIRMGQMARAALSQEAPK